MLANRLLWSRAGTPGSTSDLLAGKALREPGHSSPPTPTPPPTMIGATMRCDSCFPQRLETSLECLVASPVCSVRTREGARDLCRAALTVATSPLREVTVDQSGLGIASSWTKQGLVTDVRPACECSSVPVAAELLRWGDGLLRNDTAK